MSAAIAIAVDLDPLTEAQLRLPFVASPRTRREYRIKARWWDLEARRGYPSSPDSLRYAANMRWAAELAGLHGPGTWLELIQRAGTKNPEGKR